MKLNSHLEGVPLVPNESLHGKYSEIGRGGIFVS